MKRRLFAMLPALAAIASGSRRKSDMWSTPQGQYVLGLRAELERLGYFDNLPEDWEAVERALREGCMCFEFRCSRIDKSGKVWSRIVPFRLKVISPPYSWGPEEPSYVEHKEWGR